LPYKRAEDYLEKRGQLNTSVTTKPKQENVKKNNYQMQTYDTFEPSVKAWLGCVMANSSVSAVLKYVALKVTRLNMSKMYCGQNGQFQHGWIVS
jgi:hypothetical protein